MKTIEIIVPRNLTKKLYPYPEPCVDRDYVLIYSMHVLRYLFLRRRRLYHHF